MNVESLGGRSSGKRVVIKIGAGSMESGYAATVQIGDEGLPPQVETQARLSPAPDLPDLYARWQQAYRQLGLPYRLEVIASETNVSLAGEMARCQALSREIRTRVHNWLNDEAFRPIREKVLERLNPDDTVRILLQTQETLLQRLPWYDLEIFQRYRQAEVGICFTQYQQVNYQGSRSRQVRVLAVLGDSRGLNTETDCALLEMLPNADVKVLRGPSVEAFNRELWDAQGWDILFFAGHSQSLDACQLGGLSPSETLRERLRSAAEEGGKGQGEILLNESESLTLTQLKHALRKAIDRGLNTAIFNSCDGLGLANDLAELHIPQVLVMREPVPDQVAHAFLQGFLSAFARGLPFYVAVREAREKLEGLESRFPCATWLPVIVQNLAEMPPTWFSLQGLSLQAVGEEVNPPRPAGTPLRRGLTSGLADLDAAVIGEEQELSVDDDVIALQKGVPLRRLGVSVVAGVGAAVLALGLRFLGVLEPLELKTYDLLLRSRPAEDVDERLLIITNTAEDIRAYPNTQGQGSLADETLSALLAKLDDLGAQSIGLDIYRDYAATDATLAQQLAEMNNLVAICEAEDVDSKGTAPPPEIESSQRIGASDFAADEGGVVRRHLLALSKSETCFSNATFSTQLAMSYAQEMLNIPVTDDLAFGAARLPVIDLTVFGGDAFGGYHRVEAAGTTQMLLNYRIVKEPGQNNCGGVVETPARCISVSEFLMRSPASLEALVKQKIVLIGTTDYTFGDVWLTPYTNSVAIDQQTPGVFLQAQMISQMLSAALGERQLLRSWPLWGKVLWTVGWAMVGGFVAVSGLRLRSAPDGWVGMLLRLVLAMGLLILMTWLWLVVAAVWVPLWPSAIALLTSSLAVTASVKRLHSH